MKRTLLSLLLLLITAMLLAQNQSGYVKTRGRLGNNGELIPGERIPAAAVDVRGQNTVLSNNNGAFNIKLSDKSFYIQGVQKEGYVLFDQDVLSRQYLWSSNPLVIVMDTPERLMDDKLSAERRIRRTLQRQLQEKEDELERLKAQQQLSTEEYRNRLQALYQQEEGNENLISEMAERYSKMDFDAVDEFNRRISQYIMDGKLTEADSLINIKGDITSRAAILRQHQSANDKEEREIVRKQKKLEKSKALTQMEMKDLASDCFSKYEIFKIKHQNDSAAFYINLRASLDSANCEWIMDAASFLWQYKADYNKALSLYDRALCKSRIYRDYEVLGKCYYEKGEVYAKMNEETKAKDNLDSALFYIGKRRGMDDKDIAKTLNEMGHFHTRQRQFNSAKDCYDRAYKINSSLYGEKSLQAEGQYLYGIGIIEHETAQYQSAIGTLRQADFYYESAGDDYSLNHARILENLGMLFSQIGEPQKGLDYVRKALDIKKRYLGEVHPDVATSYHNLGVCYGAMLQHDSAIYYYSAAVPIVERVFGKRHYRAGHEYRSLGESFYVSDQIDKAREALLYSLDIIENTVGLNGEDAAGVYVILSNIYVGEHNFDKAIEYAMLTEQLYHDIYGEQHPYYAMGLCTLADIYEEKGDYSTAYDYYIRAYNLLRASLSEEHPATQLMKNQADSCKSKIQ